MHHNFVAMTIFVGADEKCEFFTPISIELTANTAKKCEFTSNCSGLSRAIVCVKNREIAMALSCPRCSTDVPDEALYCPYCNLPKPKRGFLSAEDAVEEQPATIPQ